MRHAIDVCIMRVEAYLPAVQRDKLLQVTCNPSAPSISTCNTTAAAKLVCKVSAVSSSQKQCKSSQASCSVAGVQLCFSELLWTKVEAQTVRTVQATKLSLELHAMAVSHDAMWQ